MYPKLPLTNIMRDPLVSISNVNMVWAKYSVLQYLDLELLGYCLRACLLLNQRLLEVPGAKRPAASAGVRRGPLAEASQASKRPYSRNIDRYSYIDADIDIDINLLLDYIRWHRAQEEVHRG